MLKLIITIFKWAAKILLITALILCSIFALAQTKIGKDGLIGFANYLLRDKHIKIEAAGITGKVPYNIKIDHLTLADISGTWLDIKNFAFQFSPLTLFKGRLLIKEFRAESISLDRLPTFNKSQETISNRPFSLPPLLYHIGMEHLDISRLSLGKDILGKPATFKINAQITVEEAALKSSLSLHLERTDGVKGTAFVDADIKGSEPYLTISAGIDEPEKGLLGTIMGLGTPLYLSLKGEGPSKDWNGKFFARADQLVDIDAMVGLQSLEDLHVNLDGTALLHSGLVPKFLADLSGSETSFKIKSRLKGKSDLFLDSAELKSNNASATLRGTMNIKAMTSTGALTLNINDISPFGQLIHTECTGSLELESDFKGMMSRPAFNAKFKLLGFKTAAVKAEEFEAESLVEWRSENGSPLLVMHTSAKGNIKGLHFISLSDLPERQISWALDMTGPNKGEIQIKNLRLAGETASTDISGTYNFNNTNGSFDAAVNARSLDRYSLLLGTDIPAGMGMEANLHAVKSEQTFASDISGRFTAQAGSGGLLTNIVSPEIKYSGNVEISNTGILKVSSFKLDSEKAAITGSGSYGLTDKVVHGQLNLQSDDLARLSSILKENLGGAIQVDAVANGPIDALMLKTEIKGTNLSVGHTSVQDISMSIELTGNPSRNEGTVSLKSIHQGFNLSGRSAFKLDNKVISLNGIRFEGPGFNLNGNISYDFKNSLVKGELDGDCKNLSVPSSLFGEDIHGSANFKFSFNTSNGKLADLNLHAENVSSPFGKADGLDAKVNFSGEIKNPQIVFTGSILGYENKNILLKKVEISATGPQKDLTFTLKGSGHTGFDMQIDAAGTLSLSAEEQSLNIVRLDGKYGTIPVSLNKLLQVAHSGKDIRLKSMELNLSGGSLSVTGELSDENLRLNLNIKEIPVSLLQLAGVTELEGTATGSVTLAGSLKAPEANTQLVLNNLRLKELRDSNIPPFKLTVMSEFKSNKLRTDLALEGSTGNSFKLNMDIPVNFSFSPVAWSFLQEGNLQGRLSGKVDLENIATLAGLYNHIIAGSLDMDFSLEGTLKSPKIAGHAKIENGRYENLNIGASVKNIKADITSEDSKFILNKLTGEEGKEGTVTGDGYFDLSPSRDFPYELTLNLKHVTIINTDTYNLMVWGKPSISGNVKDHIIKGKLTVEKGDFKIPERLPTEITALEVKEINGPVQEKIQERPKTKSVMKLDLSVESEGQVFLTVKGLDSEWKGDIAIKGTVSEPIITGRMSVVRGNYSFFGKRFTLTNGLIDLDGKYPPSPTIDVTGKAETTKMTAIINITGELSKLKVTLSSDPTLPQDEILSQLLFGQEIAKISPYQALELANDLNTMLGKGSFDIVGKTKSIFGIDQLTVKQQTNEKNVEESAVTVGKYLTSSFYIEIEKGIGAATSKASVTWDITPNISVDTEVGENATTGVGINWKWEY
jgi:translocation and assembly module TamB